MATGGSRGRHHDLRPAGDQAAGPERRNRRTGRSERRYRFGNHSTVRFYQLQTEAVIVVRALAHAPEKFQRKGMSRPDLGSGARTTQQGECRADTNLAHPVLGPECTLRVAGGSQNGQIGQAQLGLASGQSKRPATIVDQTQPDLVVAGRHTGRKPNQMIITQQRILGPDEGRVIAPEKSVYPRPLFSLLIQQAQNQGMRLPLRSEAGEVEDDVPGIARLLAGSHLHAVNADHFAEGGRQGSCPGRQSRSHRVRRKTL